MKLVNLFEMAQPLTFRSDIPSDEWLQNKREDNMYDTKKNEWGCPRYFGSITGYFNRAVLLPVSVLKGIKGGRGEQNLTRDDDLNSLLEYMKQNNHLPLIQNGQPNCPFITVDQKGDPWVNEGNHRIKAAVLLNWKALPIELKYFSGGEIEKGILPPEKVRAYDAHASSIGYDMSNFRGLLGEAP